jgi:hypothetical protein
MAQKRARAGGEIGTNGERYEGGEYLPSTTRPKGKAAPRKARKEQVGPYEWLIPAAGQRAIYGLIVGSVAQQTPAGLVPFAPGVAYYGETVLGYTVADLCGRYNRGERWVAVAG